MKRLILLWTCFLISMGLAIAQDKLVSGTVIDDNGEPVTGASVFAKGAATTGTVTDLDGKFSFTIPESVKTLVVSYIGYVNAEVAASENVRITLTSDTKSLSEVVVTAMGLTREKRALGYAAQEVKSDELTAGANTSLTGALQGKLTGVEITTSSGMPGASSLMTIRGSRSFTGNNTPLYVVDGMPIASTPDLDTYDSVTGADYSDRAIDIDPNDIESVNVLKGQAASALYGLRASNGVIIITTKSGKGLAKGKLHVTYNSNASFDVLSRNFDLQTTYAQGTGGIYGPTQSTSWGPKITDLPQDPGYGGETANKYTNNGASLHPGQYYVPQRANAGLDPWATPAVYNNIKDFFNTGVTLSNSVGVANSTDNSNYYLSLGNTHQTGIVPGTGMNRINAKFSADTKLNTHWTTGFTGNFVSNTMQKMTGANDGLVATVFPAPASYDMKGIPDHYDGDEYKVNNYRAGSYGGNPYWITSHDSFTEKTQRFFGNGNVAYTTKFSDVLDLKAKYQLGTDAYSTNYQDLWSFGMPGKGTNNNGDITEQQIANITLNSLLTATLTWKMSDDMNLVATYGNEINNFQQKYLYSYGSSFAFEGFNHISNAITQTNDEQSIQNRTVANFADISWDWRRMLYLDLTGRVDRVSSMPRGSRTFFYPSISAGFVFTELQGLKGSVLNYGKLRLSYAQVGQAGDYYQNYYTKPAYGGGWYAFTPIMYPVNGQGAFIPNSTIYDPDLKPQNTASYEGGIDLDFFNNLIQFSYTYSRQNVKDQIFGVPLAGSTGANVLVTNGGSIHTNTHEASLTINPVRTKDVDWSIGANFSKIDNMVDKLAPGVESIMLGGFVDPQVRVSAGEKFPVIYGTSYKRNDQGQVIVDEDGLPESDAPKVIGNVSPDFIMGFNTQLRYKFVTLSAVAEWKNGGQMYSGTNGLLDMYGVSKATAEARDKNSVIMPNSVHEDGSPNTTPITGTANIQEFYSACNNISESSIYNSSFFKLREVALKFDVYKSSKVSLGLSCFARNILLWTNLPYLDPEASQGNNNMSGGFERFSLPATTSYGLGLTLQF